MMYNYQYGDGGVVDETVSEFKAMGDNVKAAAKESKETAMMYNYQYGDGGVVEETSAEFKAMGDDFKAAQRESKETAKMYNYQYGDGGAVEEEVTKFKDYSDQQKVSVFMKCEMSYRGILSLSGYCDNTQAAKAHAEDINSGFNYVYRSND